jgi:hypothetical protein
MKVQRLRDARGEHAGRPARRCGSSNRRATLGEMGRGMLWLVGCVVSIGCSSSPADENRGTPIVLEDAADASIDTGQGELDTAAPPFDSTIDSARDDASFDAPGGDAKEAAVDTAVADTAPDVIVIEADVGECPAGSDGRACGVGGHCCGGACVTSDSIATCGTACTPCVTPSHSIAACSAGVCSSSCASGYSDCDKLASNGCEAQLATDPGNCGACGTVCPSARDATYHQVATCTGGTTCGLACAKGYESCDGSLKNGCETNLETDTFNCGACRNKCTWPDVYCVVGTCSPTP